MKRPTRKDISNEAVAEKLLIDLESFLDPDANEGDKRSALEDIADALDYAGTDGYDIAKYLDSRKSWNITAEMVEILDNASMIEYRMVSNAVRKWVEFYAIKPKLQIGDAVEVEVRKEKYRGKIASIDTKEANYTVYIEALGHVESGQGTHGVVLPFEQVEAFIMAKEKTPA